MPIQEVRKAAALILLRKSICRNNSQFVAMVKSVIEEIEQEAAQEATEEMLLRADKELAPKVIRDAVKALGY